MTNNRSAAICRAGQHKERDRVGIYNAYIAPCEDTHKART